MGGVNLVHVGIPCWWVPVHIEFANGGRAADPLQQAVLALLDRDGPPSLTEMSETLALRRPMVEAALHVLMGEKRVLATDGGWRLAEGGQAQVPTVGEGEHRAGWVAWDGVHGQAVLALWLGERPPWWRAPGEPAQADDLERGRSVMSSGNRGSRPSDRTLDEELRLMAALSELPVAEQVGSRARTMDATVRGVNRRMGKTRPGFIAVPVELRPSGPVVWRAQVAPCPEDLGELDPLGWDGLLQRVDDDTAGRLRGESDAAMVGQDVLRRLEVGSIDELRRVLSDRLRGQGIPEPWIDRVVDAEVTRKLASATDQDFRAALRGWCDVVELLARDATQSWCDDQIPEAAIRRVPARADKSNLGARQALVAPARRLLGASTDQVVGRLHGTNLRRLSKKLRRGASVGELLFAIGAMAVLHVPTRRALERADRGSRRELGRGWLEVMDRLREERNAIVHPDRGDEGPRAVGFREHALALVRLTAQADAG